MTETPPLPDGIAAKPESPADADPKPSEGRVARAVARARSRGRHPEIAAVLALLVPGLGHIFLERYAKGLVALVLLLGLWLTGFFMTGGECVSLDKEKGHPYAFFAQVGCGLPTGIAALVNRERPYTSSDDYHKEEFIKRLPRLDEGLLYTMIAGLLNLLLVHDALLGAPGGLRRDEERKLA